MTAAEIQDLLDRGRVGHLGLASQGDAYVLPLLYAYDGRYVYFNSHPGIKNKYLDATREACFTVTNHRGPEEWQSVQVFGPLEILTNPEERLQATDALLGVPMPPLMGTTSQGSPRHDTQGFFLYRLRPDRISGRKSHAYEVVR